MLSQSLQPGKHNRRADEKHRLMLQGGHDDFMGRADAVDISRTITDREIAGIHHAQVDVQGLPELFGAPGPGLRPLFSTSVSPTFADLVAALGVFPSILMQPADVGFEPRIENGDAHGLQKLADAVAPPELLLSGARGDKVHWPR